MTPPPASPLSPGSDHHPEVSSLCLHSAPNREIDPSMKEIRWLWGWGVHTRLKDDWWTGEEHVGQTCRVCEAIDDGE